MNKSIIYKEDKDIQEDLRKLRALQQDTCEDCISREHLLEEIASLKESPWFKDDTNCAMAIRKEAIEIVEDLCIRKEPSVNPQKEDWISVSKRLPKIAGVYRVTRYFPNNRIIPNYLVDACFFDGSNTWYNDNRINNERAYADNVIAWQENPDPYKAESEDKE